MDKRIVKAHSIQKNKILNNIAYNGMINTFDHYVLLKI